jgi:cyanophycin synthetase
MEIVSMRNYSSRNIFSHKPVVRMVVELGEFAEITTDNIEGFNDRLLDCFPGLKTHYCSPGYEGGFVERLIEGTLLSHVTEHLALELQCLLGYDVYFGKTRLIREPDRYCILYEYIDESCAAEAGNAAAEIVLALARNDLIDIDEKLEDLYLVSNASNLGPSTQAIYDEARRRHIPVRRLGENSLLQLGYGKQMRFIEASLPDNTSSIAVDVAKNKQLVKNLLKENNIPVPKGGIVDSEDAAVVLAEEIGYPVVIKPFDANQGRGVSVNVTDENSLRAAYRRAYSLSERVMVEKHIRGKDYRILVVGNKVSAAARRIPPYVIGDGIHSIAELTEEENRSTRRGTGHEKPLTNIIIDAVAKELLARLGLSEKDIPPDGELVYLRENGNLSTGGSASDCTTDIHPVNKELAIKAAKIIGLDVAGIDMVADNISQPLTSSNGAIIEVNAAPGLRMHLYPAEGTDRNVVADILERMYPPGTEPSIPIVSVTGTNGKTTVTRLIRHVLMLAGKNVGMTCSSGTFIGRECIAKGDHTGPLSAQSILYNREVETAVLETARGGIIRRGLGYDLADVGIITNISEDHLEMDGVNTLYDLAFVKSLVVEAVKPNGYAVLNADDQMTEGIIRKVDSNLVLFSRNRNNELIDNHINKGYTAVIAEENDIFLYQNSLKNKIMVVNEIPITFDGRAVCNIENSLAAVAGLIALGIKDQTIRLGLMTFTPDPVVNQGRFNLFNMGDFQILLDYGHNLSGYQCVIEFMNKMNAARLVGVIGVPGDRPDKAAFDVGVISGRGFNRIYIKEDEDRRGREPGEIAEILYKGAVHGGTDRDNIEIVLSEQEALRTAINNVMPGDLIVMFYESFDNAYGLIQDYINGKNKHSVLRFSNDAICKVIDNPPIETELGIANIQ